MKNETNQPESSYNLINESQQREIARLYPHVTDDELAEAIQWSDWTVQRQIEEDNRNLEADTIVEMDLGCRSIHIFFLKGIVQGSYTC